MQNTVIKIRKLVPVDHWRHCTRNQNPADISSRGASTLELGEKLGLWLNGPSTIQAPAERVELEDVTVMDKCLAELKAGNREKGLLTCSAAMIPVLSSPVNTTVV